MLHDPEVLILDEPTSGLDPNQLVEIRDLIKSLGEEKTVILSTHILREVEAVCSRAIIIHKGKLVADAPIGTLRQTFTAHNHTTVEFNQPIDPRLIRSIPGVSSVEVLSDKKFILQSPSDLDIRPSVFAFAAYQKVSLLELHLAVQSVEDVFQQLTK